MKQSALPFTKRDRQTTPKKSFSVSFLSVSSSPLKNNGNIYKEKKNSIECLQTLKLFFNSPYRVTKNHRNQVAIHASHPPFSKIEDFSIQPDSPHIPQAEKGKKIFSNNFSPHHLKNFLISLFCLPSNFFFIKSFFFLLLSHRSRQQDNRQVNTSTIMGGIIHS